MFRLMKANKDQMTRAVNTGYLDLLEKEVSLPSYGGITTEGLLCYFTCNDETSPVKDEINGITLSSYGRVRLGQEGHTEKSWYGYGDDYDDSGYLTTSSQNAFTIPDTFTMSILIKPIRGYSNAPIFEFGSYDRNTGYGIWINDSRQITCRVNQNWQDYGKSLTANVWHHVVYTYDKQMIRVYVNGLPYKSRSCTATPNKTTYVHAFSRSPGAGSWYENYNGYLDEVRLYDRVFDESEVVKLAKAYKLYEGGNDV